MNIRCVLTDLQQEQHAFEKCIRFHLIRERYQPFSTLYIQLAAEDVSFQPCSAFFYLEQQELMHGTVQKYSFLKRKNQYILQAQIRSFSCCLSRNQLVPGLYPNTTLSDLLNAYRLPHLTYEDVPAISYIYVREHAGIWDSVVAYNYKLNHGYPFIRNSNHLCMLPRTDSVAINLPAHHIIQESSGGDTSGLVSRIEMANLAGEYGSFAADNPEAAAREIVSVRQIQMDRQFLYHPEDALQFRIALSNRRLRSKTVVYQGYCGEDLEDLIQVNGEISGRVSRIAVSGNEKGIFTEDTFYFDSFCNP
ncbi:MAG: hypothetical protein MJ071_05070 [Oscillospiraceae bacterium]|nr:hypothetical protein [Oscillospiraceae bacterium]